MITNLWFGGTAFLDLDLAHKDSMTSSFGPKNWSFKKFVFKYVNLWNETNFLMESKCDAKISQKFDVQKQFIWNIL